MENLWTICPLCDTKLVTVSSIYSTYGQLKCTNEHYKAEWSGYGCAWITITINGYSYEIDMDSMDCLDKLEKCIEAYRRQKEEESQQVDKLITIIGL